MVVWSTLLTVLQNLLQLLFLPYLLQSNFQVYTPLSSLVLAPALYLLCLCLQQGKNSRRTTSPLSEVLPWPLPYI